MSASLAGAGALLASSATLFTVMKWAGAAYLIWLGLRMWKADHSVVEAKIRERRALLSVFRKCFVVTALNPKDILFFVAFVPQFVDANAPFGPQVVILQATFLSMVAINIAFWSLSAGQLRDTFANPNRMKLLNRFGGGCLISAGALAART
jgi:threonine/homoserine/homoserine lactone efflux protein